MKELLKSSSALVAVAFLLQPMIAAAKGPIVTEQPNLLQPVKGNAISPEQDPPLSNSEMADLVRKKIKYVFVIFNENNSFDHEYGTFPGSTACISMARSRAPPPTRLDSRRPTRT